MSATTGIEWTDATWSPIRARVKPNAGEIAAAKGYTSLVQIATKMQGRVGQHCEKVSPGCEHLHRKQQAAFWMAAPGRRCRNERRDCAARQTGGFGRT